MQIESFLELLRSVLDLRSNYFCVRINTKIINKCTNVHKNLISS